MTIIQVRLEPDEQEGTHSGYYNYEFGKVLEQQDEDGDVICDFFGPERGQEANRKRRNYSVQHSEAYFITIDEED